MSNYCGECGAEMYAGDECCEECGHWYEEEYDADTLELCTDDDCVGCNGDEEIEDEINYTITSQNVSFALDGEMYSYPKTKENFEAICKALIANDLCALRNELTSGQKNISFLNGKIFTKHGVLCVCSNGVEYSVDDRLFERLCKLLNENEDIRPMINFIDNLYQNPDIESINDMYRFLVHNELPITEDGCFIAYKKVCDNYTDIHSGTFSNKIGQVCEMPRENVELNREQTCSSGLHFCSKGYLPYFGDAYSSRIMVLKINPKDVVSIPTDYNNAKGRTCRYEVIEELERSNIQGSIEEIESSSICRKIGNWFKSLIG